MITGQVTIDQYMDTVELDYKIEAVYEKIFGVKKFRNYIRDCKRNEIIAYMKFQGKYYLGCGWSRKNTTIIDVSPSGIMFNYKDIHSFEEIADLLIKKYGEKMY